VFDAVQSAFFIAFYLFLGNVFDDMFVRKFVAFRKKFFDEIYRLAL
jgi:hypothetical protein